MDSFKLVATPVSEDALPLKIRMRARAALVIGTGTQTFEEWRVYQDPIIIRAAVLNGLAFQIEDDVTPG